jgi:hypothetical protein
MSEEQSGRRERTVLEYEVNGDERLSDGVVAAVAEAADADPAAIAPLAEAIDSDALDALFADRYDGTARTTGHVQFLFWGYEVVVTDDGRVSVLNAAE